MNLLKEISETNSDLKAKQLLTQITIKRQRNEKLTKEIELATINNENYIPIVLPDPKYNFPETLLPPLKNVLFIKCILFISSKFFLYFTFRFSHL